MQIEFSDIVLLNAELKEYQSRYCIKYKNEKTACVEPPGECCLTETMKKRTKQCIERYYSEKNAKAVFSEDFLYFHLEDIEMER